MATLNCPKSSHFLKSSGLLRAMNEMVYLAPDVFRFPCFIVPDLQTTCGVEWLIHPEFQNITTNIKYPRFLDIRIFCVLSEQKLMRQYVRTNICATIFVTRQMPTFSLEKIFLRVEKFLMLCGEEHGGKVCLSDNVWKTW